MKYRPGVYTEVEIDGYEIEQAGYHHEDDCPAKNAATPRGTTREDAEEALAELHRAAHPRERMDPWHCLSEPCRSYFKVGAQGVAA